MPGSYDVIVVGAGPGGSTAARVLAGQGRRVLLLDSKKFPRPKLCGGALTAKTLILLDRVFGPRPRRLFESGELGFGTTGYEIRYRNRRLLHTEAEFPFYFLERERYDAMLLSEARAAGADVLEGTPAVSVDVDALEVHTREASFHGHSIIGADGARSVVRRAVLAKQGRAKQDWGTDIGTALEVFISRTEAARQVDHAIVEFGYVKSGYAWIFPYVDQLAVGIGGIIGRNQGNFRECLHKYLAATAVVGDEAPRYHGHPVPVATFRDKPAFGSVLLVGDAGGFVDPLTGEGIYFAQRTAELACEAIATPSPSTQYLSLLESHVYPVLRASARLRKLLFFASDHGLYQPIGWFVRSQQRRLIRHLHLAGEEANDVPGSPLPPTERMPASQDPARRDE